MPLSTAVKAIEFTAITLLPWTSEISEFQQIFDGTWNNCEMETPDFITSIRNRFGFSTWLAGEEIVQLLTNNDKASQYLNSLQAADKLGLCNLLARERFCACADSTAVTDLEEMIQQAGYPEQLRAIITAWVHPTPKINEKEIGSILAFAIQFPVIDRWLLLLRCVGAFLATSEFEIRLEKLKSAKVFIEVLDNAGGVFSENLKRMFNPTNYCESNGGKTILHPVEKLLVEAITTNIEVICEKESAEKPLSLALKGLIVPDRGKSAGHLAVLAREAVVEASGRIGTVLASVVGQCMPLTERRAESAIIWLKLFGHNSLISACEGGRFGHVLRLHKIGSNRGTYDALVEASKKQQYLEVIALAENEGVKTIEEEAILLDAYLLNGSNDAAVELANNIIINYPEIAERLPVSELINAVPEEVTTDLKTGVNRALLSNFCARYELPKAANKRNDYLEDVLDIAEVEYPSDAIERLLSELPPAIAINFLENVCVPQVMDTVPVGSSTEDLLTERIRILSALRSMILESSISVIGRIEGSAERYELEMKNVATYLAVTSEMASLDQSRVYVDTEGLRLRLGTTLNDDFQRFRRFAALDIRLDRDLDKLRQLLSEQFPDVTVVDLNELTRALTSESDRALSKMLVHIRDGFAVSHEFGLDGYLSGGIRHGNLEFHLREPFLKGDLLGTLRSDGGFEPPKLAKTVAELCRDPNLGKCIQDAFHQLARNLQGVIDEVLMKWVQVDLDASRPEAFFQLSLTQVNARVLEPELRKASSLEEFIGICIRYWWTVIDDNLHKARERIKDDLHERLIALLRDLETCCCTVIDVQPIQQILRDQIGTVADALATAITKLAEWFHRPTTSATEDVEATTAVDVCLKLLGGMFPKMEIQPTVNVVPSSAKLARREFKHWVDIMHALFVNAAEHGGETEICKLTVNWHFDADRILLTVKNILGKGIDQEKIDAKLEKSRLRMEETAALSRVSTEGSSGLIKVIKYARNDLRCPDAALNLIRLDNSVIATIEMPGKNGIKQ